MTSKFLNLSTDGTLAGNDDNTAVSEKAIKTYVDTLDSNTVHKTGNETIVGTKTFSSNIIGNLTGTASKATADADGNVFKTKYIKNEDVLLDMSQHSTVSPKRIWQEKIDDCLYRAEARYTVTGTNFTSNNLKHLFDCNPDTVLGVAKGTTGVLSITASINFGWGYPYGYLYCVFYSRSGPQSINNVTCRVYQNWSGHNTGWVTLAGQEISSSTFDGIKSIDTLRFPCNTYGIEQIEITFDNTNGTAESTELMKICSASFFCNRTNIHSLPVLTKHGGDTVYGNLTIPTTSGSFIGNLTGNASTATTATQDGDGNTISSTYTKKTDIMGGATSSSAGTAGLVPAPAIADKDKFLRGDGIWATPDGTGGAASFPLFYHTFADHLLSDASWLRADTFSWQSGSVYPSAYQHLVDDIAGKTAETETIGGITITFYRATDGHKIVLASEETNIADLYDATGVAWYYVLDTANTRFKLPRMLPFGDSAPVVGNGMTLGLTDGTNNDGLALNSGGVFTVNSAVYGASAGSGVGPSSVISPLVGVGVTEDKSKSGLIANLSHTSNDGAYKYLYFYVGNTVQDQTIIDVGEITEALNDKLDLDAGNATSTTKQNVLQWGAPDYSAPIDVGFPLAATTYTAPCDGIYVACFIVNNQSSTLRINGELSGYIVQSASSYRDTSSMTIPLSKGDVIYWTARYSSLQTSIFYPFKGAN